MFGPSWGWDSFCSVNTFEPTNLADRTDLNVDRGVREVDPNVMERRSPRKRLRKQPSATPPLPLAVLNELQISTLGILGLAEAAKATGDYEECDLWSSVEEEATRIAQNLQHFLGELQRHYTEMN